MQSPSVTRGIDVLSHRQIAEFRRDGYLVVESLLDWATDLVPVLEEVSAVCDTLSGNGKNIDEIVEAIWDGKLHGPAFFDLITNPKLLDVAESLVGPEVIASSVYRLRPKLPGHRKSPVPWHQDSAYFSPNCDSLLIITVWIPLVDATEENGCLWVIPGVHQEKQVLTHEQCGPYLKLNERALRDRIAPVCVPVVAGGVLLMTNLTPHASFENKSDEIRWSMDIRYQSAVAPTNARITRLEGEDRGIACYPPESDFLVRSRARPGEVIEDPKAFEQLREISTGQRPPRRWK